MEAGPELRERLDDAKIRVARNGVERDHPRSTRRTAVQGYPETVTGR